MTPVIVGFGALLSNPACCVIKDGQIASAVEQSKIARQDRPGVFPDAAFRTALEIAQTTPDEITCIAVARPFAAGSESDAQMALRARFPTADIAVIEHHHAHAASAYYASPYSSAAVLSIDRAGDFRSAMLFRGEENHLTPTRELYFPDSLGDLFARVTDLLGFQPRQDEHKVQWLSASGAPMLQAVFESILRQRESPWSRMDRSYFDADRLTHGGFSNRFFEAASIEAGQDLTPRLRADIATSLQRATVEAVIAMLGNATSVCVAGGLAFNALLVHALEESYGNVFVQPVSGNAGTALGAALHSWHNHYGEKGRVPFTTLSLGPAFSPSQVKEVLENCKLRFRFLLTEGELIREAIRALSDNKIIGWMQGRMEFGPRALGNRSILASPLNPYSTENLNVYIKHRENFRKFAASVPEDLASRYFEVGPNARFLATVGRVRLEYRDQFSAALLGEDMIRVHTVRREDNPLYYALLEAAGRTSGLPVLYNTSFNLFGDPLVCTPRDAVRSFYSSGIDELFVGNFALEK